MREMDAVRVLEVGESLIILQRGCRTGLTTAMCQWICNTPGSFSVECYGKRDMKTVKQLIRSMKPFNPRRIKVNLQRHADEVNYEVTERYFTLPPDEDDTRFLGQTVIAQAYEIKACDRVLASY